MGFLIQGLEIILACQFKVAHLGIGNKGHCKRQAQYCVPVTRRRYHRKVDSVNGQPCSMVQVLGNRDLYPFKFAAGPGRAHGEPALRGRPAQAPLRRLRQALLQRLPPPVPPPRPARGEARGEGTINK